MATETLSIGEYLSFLAPTLWPSRRVPEWPPDVYALTAALLGHSEAYSLVVTEKPFGSAPWKLRANRVGVAWRRNLEKGDEPPRPVTSRWRKLIAAQSVPVHQLVDNRVLALALLSDDPGCSVLSVTSLGMARLSRADDGSCGSRVVALWKDDKDGRSVPIALPDKSVIIR